MMRLLLISAASLAAVASIGKEIELTGPQIRSAISGKYVTDEHRTWRPPASSRLGSRAAR